MNEPALLEPDWFEGGIPHTKFAALRRDKPAFQTTSSEGIRAWNLVRYADVASIVNAKRGTAVQPHFATVEPGTEPDGEGQLWRHKAMMTLNPPEHGPYRHSVSPNVKRDRVEAFRPVVAETTLSFVEQAGELSQFDAVSEFAAPLASAITCDYLGIDQANRDLVRRLSASFMGDNIPPTSVGDYAKLKVGPRALRSLQGSPMRAATELMHEAWRKLPWLDEAFVESAPHWAVEDYAMQHLTAGVAGLRNCICVAITELARSNPERATWLSHLSGAADETLRYATPLLRGKRLLTEPLDIHGAQMREGELVQVWFASANFDDAKFADPLSFDPTRSPNPHMSFSGGAHHCLGAPLVRVELEEVLRAILTGWPTVRMRGAPDVFRSNVVHDIVRLPLSLGE